MRPIESITDEDEKRGYHYNQKGAKVFLDVMQQPLLDIPVGQTVYHVLSAGSMRSGQICVPVLTILENDTPVCYRLPDSYLDWTMTLVGMADAGVNFFPCDVRLSNINGSYFADVL